MRDMLCKIRQYLTSGHQPFCHIVNYLLITLQLSPCCIWLETVGQNHQWYTSTTFNPSDDNDFQREEKTASNSLANYIKCAALS